MASQRLLSALVAIAVVLSVRARILGQPTVPTDRLGDSPPDGISGGVGTLGTKPWPGFDSPRYEITQLVIAPDGRTAAAVLHAPHSNVSWNNAIATWDIRTRQPRVRWRVDRHLLVEPGFTPDGKSLLAILCPPPFTALCWDVATGQVRGKDALDAHRAEHGGGISPDGRAVGWTLSSGRLEVMDLVSHKRQTIPMCRRMERPKVMALSGGFAPDGRRLACISVDLISDKEDAIYLTQWDLEHGQELPRIQIPQSSMGIVDSHSYSADGRLLAATVPCAGEGELFTEAVCWEVATGKECLRVKQPTLRRACALAPNGRRLAMGWDDGSIAVWEVPNARRIGVLEGHHGQVNALRFTPDAKTLVSGGADATVRFWDMTQHAPSPVPLGSLDARWADLANGHSATAYRAIWALADAPAQAVPLLAAKLKPAATADPAQVRQWIVDLGSEQYELRQAATRELQQLGCQVTRPLQEALKAVPPLETSRRLERLLESARGAPASAELRALRGVHVLELIGSPAAQTLLKTLAKGAPGARQTWEARAALDRLQKRSAK
jgi:WD40 repeat protein